MIPTPEEQLDFLRKAMEERQQGDILLVEDSENDALLTKKSLEAVGLKVFWVVDTIGVQEVLANHNPRITFLDLNLGNASGLNVLAFIKKFQPDSKVVILTGAYEHGSSECIQALNQGAMLIMKKPLKMEHIEFIFCTPRL